MKAYNLICIAAVMAVVGCGSSSTGPSKSNTMTGGGGGGGTTPSMGGGHSMTVTGTGSNTAPNYFFTPTPDTIAVGSTLSFTATDVEHNVVFDTPGSPTNPGVIFNSTVMTVFPTAGSFNYHCTIHPFMTGVVVVH